MDNHLLQSVVDGFLLGSVYGVAAMGLTLIWGVMRVINLTHGPLIVIGMFATYLIFTNFGLNPYVALVFVAALGLLFGLVIYFIAVQRVINAPYLSSLLSTYAVSMIIIGVGTFVFTSSPQNIDYSLGTLAVGALSMPANRVVGAITAFIVAGLLYLFLNRTRPGKAIRAVANNRAAAELMGIPSNRILALSFGIGATLAVVAGGVIATFFPFTILSGGDYQLKSFVIGVLGGLGNPVGALFAGLLLGMVEGVVPMFMPVGWVPVLEFILFIAVLVLFPNGLFGARRR
ncbi:MAG: branched-chain amino acid ABC transporter permease [Anaerolineae bacterium]